MAQRPPLPPRDGVGPTRLRVPRSGPWATIADHMTARFEHMDPEVLRARFSRGEVVGEDGAPLPLDTPLGAHEFIWYYREPPVEREIPFDIEVLHRDDDLIVIDKPHFLPTTPSGKFLQNSALVRLRRLLGDDDIVPIHRLDRLTAGVVMFSARSETRGAYQTLFERREVSKVYEATSAVGPHIGIRFPLTVRSHIRKRRGVLRVEEVSGAEPNAETRIELGEHRDGMLRTVLRPRTGQMHQLRVHLAGLGVPILGDPFYPVLLDEAPDDFARPLQLLARELSFTDPLTGRPRHFTTGLRLAVPGPSTRSGSGTTQSGR